MKQISATTFKLLIVKDRAWAHKLSEPVEVIGYCNMEHYPITHLSPFLHFSSQNELGKSASFAWCKRLQIAEGNFAGFVSFEHSGIEEIGQLDIKGVDSYSAAASFANCENLKIARGIYPGYVKFDESGIEKIGDLEVTGRNGIVGWSACFRSCTRLKVAEGKFRGYVDFTRSGVQEIGHLEIENKQRGSAFSGIKAGFSHCTNLQEIPSRFNPKELIASYDILCRLIKKRAAIRRLRSKIKREI